MTNPKDAALQIRRLRSRDLDLARRLFVMMASVFGESCESLSDDYLNGLLSRADFWALCVTESGEVIGGLTAYALALTRAETEELFIYDVAVRTDHQRRGVGRALWAALQAEASAAGIEVLFVPAETVDVHALEFYRALGGVPTSVTMFTFDAESRHGPSS